MMGHELQSELGAIIIQWTYMAIPLLRSHTRKKLPYISQLLHIIAMSRFRVTGGSTPKIGYGMMTHGLQSQMGVTMVQGSYMEKPLLRSLKRKKLPYIAK